MGTTTDKLTYLNNTKSLLKDRLNSLGATITSSTTFRNYLTWLDTFYEEVGDKTDIATNGIQGKTNQKTTTGKQLFDKNNPNVINGYINGSHVIKSNNESKIIYIECEPNTTYSMQKMLQETLGANRFRVGTSENIPTINTTLSNYYNAGDGSSITEYTLTTNSSANYLVFFCYNTEQLTTFSEMLDSIQIEENSSCTDYEEYTGGQPSPSKNYPQNINTLTSNVDYTICGKNLFNKNLITNSKYLSVGGSETDNSQWGISEYILIKPNTTYTLSGLKGSSPTACFYDKNKTYISDIGAYSNNLTKTFTSPSNAKYFRMSVINETDNPNYNLNICMLEQGSTATTYQAYIEPKTVTIPLGDIELAEIEDYKDKVYSNNDKFYLEKEIDKINSYNGETISTDYKSTTGGLNTGATVYYVTTATKTEITSSNYPELYAALKEIQDYLTSYKINKEFILGYSSPNIEY